MYVDLLANINEKLKRQLIPSRVLLSRFALLDEQSRQAFDYTDPRNMPFFYYLGRQIQPQTFCEFGLRLGLCSGTFLLGCRSVEHFLGFQQDGKSHSLRMSLRNIKKVYKRDASVYLGHLSDEAFVNMFGHHRWDLIAINEDCSYDEYMAYLHFAWKGLSENGQIIMNYVNYHNKATSAYHDFVKIKNKAPAIFNTKYGIGLLER